MNVSVQYTIICAVIFEVYNQFTEVFWSKEFFSNAYWWTEHWWRNYLCPFRMWPTELPASDPLTVSYWTFIQKILKTWLSLSCSSNKRGSNSVNIFILVKYVFTNNSKNMTNLYFQALFSPFPVYCPKCLLRKQI